MKRDKIIIGVFLFVVFGVFLALPINFAISKVQHLEVNKDNWVSYNAKTEKNFVDKINNKIGRIENAVENRITNYFPFYQTLNTFYQNFNFYTNKLVFNEVPIRTNSDGEYVFYDKNNEFYFLENKYSDKDLEERLNRQVNFFNELSKKGIDLYIYIPTRYEFTTLKTNNLSKYTEEFVNKLNENIKVKVMNVDTIDNYKKYFYKTDHHWTINGALKGYEDITDMLNISKVDNLNITEHKERKYYGSLAKTALNDLIFDYISDIDLDLNYNVSLNGKEKDELFKPREIRLDRSYKYYDYYVSYFNGQYGNIVYDYNDDTKDNLLIVGDSYSWQIDYLIASSFNKTHVVNLRYDEYKNNNFDLIKYVTKNNINKVLFLYDGGSTLFDQYNYNFEGRVK